MKGISGITSVSLEQTLDGNLVVGQSACCSECARKGEVQPGHFAFAGQTRRSSAWKMLASSHLSLSMVHGATAGTGRPATR